MDLGATLREARETRGLTCDQLARTTRIPQRMLLAMEHDDWAKLPGGIFTRGYLRAYAHEVGLDAEALVRQFEAEHAPPAPHAEPAAEPPPQRRPQGVVVRWPRWELPEATSRWLTWPALGLALVLGLYLGPYFSGRSSTRDQQARSAPAERPAPVAGPASSLGEQQAHPVGTAASRASAASSDVALPLPGADVPIVMDLAVTRPCWVTATADGARSIFRILQPGERVQVRGRVLTIRVGDAAALQLSLDGQPARPLGASGEVLTLRITRDSYRSLLPPRPVG